MQSFFGGASPLSLKRLVGDLFLFLPCSCVGQASKTLRRTAGKFASSGSDRVCVFLHKRQALKARKSITHEIGVLELLYLM